MDVAYFDSFFFSEIFLLVFSLIFLLIDKNNIYENKLINFFLSFFKRVLRYFDYLSFQNFKLFLSYLIITPFVFVNELYKFRLVFSEVETISFSYFDYLFINDKLSFFFKLFI